MEKSIIVYISFYAREENNFLELKKTILSIIKYDDLFRVIKICYQQKEIKDKIISVLEQIKTDSNQNTKFKLENIILYFIDEKIPPFLPIDVFNYIKNDKETSDESIIYYTESDQILFIKEEFKEKIYFELSKNNKIIMPHRLGKTKGSPNDDYLTYNGFYVGNYSSQGIKKYDDTFNRVFNRRSPFVITSNFPFLRRVRPYVCAYAGCWFSKKSNLKHIKLEKPYLGSYFYHREISKTIYERNERNSKIACYPGFRNKILYFFSRLDILSLISIIYNVLWTFHLLSHPPYRWCLEAPSIVLNKPIYKPKDIGALYVIHLSHNWYV